MNLICKIFGHQKIVRDWYPTDPISSIGCRRCKKVLDSTINPIFTGSVTPVLFKVICIKNTPNVTVNKIYDVFHQRDGRYFIKDDNGKLNNFSWRNFTSDIKEWRRAKLKKINESTLHR
jgi:hypothetical protein